MKLNIPFNVRVALWMGAVTIALCGIFIPVWFESGDTLPAEWSEEVSIPPLEDEDVELAAIRGVDALASDAEQADPDVVAVTQIAQAEQGPHTEIEA